MSPATFNPGEGARVRQSIHSPYSGRAGIVLDFDPSDKRGAYLVLFSDGLRFRYKGEELESLAAPTPPSAPPPSKVLGTLSRVISETRQGLFRGPHR
jgi:hypothetical protein